MKWHHILGLVTGLFVVSWIVSGWLSMDHGRLFSTANPSLQQVSAVSGGSFGEVTSRANIADLRERTAAVEFSFHAFGGAAIVVSKNQQGAISAPMLEPGLVANVVAGAFPGISVKRWRVVPPNDSYAKLREGSLPLGTVRVEMSDSSKTWVHIDGRSGEILSVLDQSRRVYRWLYNGMHSLDIPGLVDTRPLWDILMLVLLLSGFSASTTGIVIGVKRVLAARHN